MIQRSFHKDCRSLAAAKPVFIAVCLAGASFGAVGSAVAESARVWHPWFEIGGYYNSRDDDGRGSFGTSRGETTLFAPITGSEQDLLFTQVTAKFFADDAQEGNLALGYRRMVSPSIILGGWLGADARHTELGNTFWQMSGGLELLSQSVDFRFNWYGPITDPKTTSADVAEARISGDQIFVVGSEEVGLKGVDGEIGYKLPIEMAGLDPSVFELRAYGGGFYFDDSAALEEIAGGKARVELRINDVIEQLPGSRLTAEYEITHDDVRDTRHEVGLRLRIPLAKATSAASTRSSRGLQNRMLDAIERDTDIVTTLSGPEAVEDALTGTDLERVAYASPNQDISATSSAAGANSLVVVNGTVVGGQSLVADQTLAGGGAAFSVRGLKTGLVVPVTAPGRAGRLTGAATDVDSLTLNGWNTHVTGLRVIGSGFAGVGDGIEVASSGRNIQLTNLRISRTGGDAIDIDNRSWVTISNVSTINTGESGVDINNGNRVSISQVEITNAGSDGIQINDNNNISISGLSLTNAPGSDGIQMDDGNVITITDSVIQGSLGDGIELDNGNVLSVSNSRITDAVFGVFASGDGNRVSLTGSTFSNINLVGLLNIGDGNRFIVDDSLFFNVGGDAFNFDQSGLATLRISNTTFAGNFGFGLFFFSDGQTSVLDGSDGNINTATLGLGPCTAVPGSFTGTISFVDGTSLIDDVAPCN
ncbi:MAG: right-handed parallel beta-helix repeat-containing protein [Filomicrobium sp.]